MAAPQYATLDDLFDVGLRREKCEGLVNPDDYATDAERWAAIEAKLNAILEKRSRYADGYLAARHTLPITAWESDLSTAVSQLGAWDVMRLVGYNPDIPGNDIWEKARDEANAWLRDVSTGKVVPVGIVDSTVDKTETGISLSSEPLRGWGCLR